MEYGQAWCRDGISVRDLQVQSALSHGLDAWGRQKDQPCLLSVHLSFKSGFDSAADQDALDASTMHYGVLSKNLRKLPAGESWGDLGQMAHVVLAVVDKTPPGSKIMENATIEIKLPKASLLGDAVIFVRNYHIDSQRNTSILHLQNLCIPTLIGVNSNERTAKQKLLVNVWLRGLDDGECNCYVELERFLTKIIEPTEFETLESLAVYVLKELYKSFATLRLEGKSIRLRLAKPQAVPWAEAPAIEMFRTSEQLSRGTSSE